MTKDRGRQEGCSPFDLNIFFSPSSRSLNGDLNKDSKINIENRGENSVSCHSSKHQTERRGTSQSIKMITNHSSSNSATPRSDPPHPPDHLEDPNCAISKSGNKIRISEKIARCPDKHHQGNRNGHQSRFNDKEVPGEKLAAGKLLINNREKMLESEGAEDSSMISQNLRRNTSSGPSFRSENLHDSSELTPRSSKSQRHPPASTILFDMPDPADPSKMSPKGTVQDQLETSQGLMETILGALKDEIMSPANQSHVQQRPLPNAFEKPRETFVNSANLNYYHAQQFQNQQPQVAYTSPPYTPVSRAAMGSSPFPPQGFGYQGPLVFQPIPARPFAAIQQHSPYPPPNYLWDQSMPQIPRQMSHHPNHPNPYNHFYCQPPANIGPVKQCSNCGATSTPSWRRCPEGKNLLCNACGLYVKLHNRPRPVRIAEDGSIRVQRAQPSIETSQPAFHCERCLTRETPLWRKDERGKILCNACALYLKNHNLGVSGFHQTSACSPQFGMQASTTLHPGLNGFQSGSAESQIGTINDRIGINSQPRHHPQNGTEDSLFLASLVSGESNEASY